MQYHIEHQFPTSGATAASWPFTRIPDLIIIHSTRSGVDDDWWTLDHELSATLNSYMEGGDNSSHCVIAGNGDVYWTVALNRMAWGAEYLNGRAFHIEICQPTRDTPYTDAQYIGTKDAINVIRQTAPHIPLFHVADENQSGLIGHEETAQGQADGKSDPGYLFEWDRLFQEDSMTIPEYGFPDFYDGFDELVSRIGVSTVGMPLHPARNADPRDIDVVGTHIGTAPDGAVIKLQVEQKNHHMVYQLTQKGRLESVKLDDGNWVSRFYPSVA